MFGYKKRIADLKASYIKDFEYLNRIINTHIYGPDIQFTAMQEVVKKLMAEVEALKAPENDIEEYREKVISEFFMRGLVISPMENYQDMPFVRMHIKIDGNELASRATAVGHLVSERELIDDAVLRLRESILHRLEALYVPKEGY